MLYITDHFDVGNVPLENVKDIRFEEIRHTAVKVMTTRVDYMTKLASKDLKTTISILTGRIGEEEHVGKIRLMPTDVMILVVHEPVIAGGYGSCRKFFRVTARREFEVFTLPGGCCILDRDGNVTEVGDYMTLKVKCEMANNNY